MTQRRRRLLLFALGNVVVVTLLAGVLARGLVALDPASAVLLLGLLVAGDVVAAVLLERGVRE
ncbi:MAG: hypothetical protein KKA73_04635 [Chloroflexi bacterium]|nr:hypothetical protein [Chloroflexota bacterium]MBU1746953.1 hypothetical protein [Chloroflexota bacterium]